LFVRHLHGPFRWFVRGPAKQYDQERYVTGVTEGQLTGAPKYSDESSWKWSDPAVARSIDDYYRSIPAP
jgi:hypothetical protein